MSKRSADLLLQDMLESGEKIMDSSVFYEGGI